MAHNLMVDGDEVAMFCTGKREDAWHLLGQRVDKAATSAEAIKLAGLDWLVEKLQLSLDCPIVPPGIQKIPAWGTFRKNKQGQRVFLATVGPQYKVVQNRQAFDFCDALLEGVGTGAHYESAGALGNGERVWVLVQLPGDFRINGTEDWHHRYLVFITGHDGKVGVLVKNTSVRVVCQNTMEVAVHGAGAFVALRHTQSVDKRLKQVEQLMKGVNEDYAAFAVKLNALARRKMTKDTMQEVFDRLFPAKEKDGDEAQERHEERRDRMLADILRLYEANDDGAIPQIAGTAYNMLNAITQWADHFRDVRITAKKSGMKEQEVRALAAVTQGPARKKQEAVQVLLDVTLHNPVHIIGKPCSVSSLVQ
jgi:phage/plasmid-like protein (TIGR03299 family)